MYLFRENAPEKINFCNEGSQPFSEDILDLTSAIYMEVEYQLEFCVISRFDDPYGL